VRVMMRLLTQADALQGVAPVVWRNHRRLAKKRALAIQYCRGKKTDVSLAQVMLGQGTEDGLRHPIFAAAYLEVDWARPVSPSGEARPMPRRFQVC
jgi:hypothetical protein